MTTDLLFGNNIKSSTIHQDLLYSKEDDPAEQAEFALP